jgi:hypothetical protein
MSFTSRGHGTSQCACWTQCIRSYQLYSLTGSTDLQSDTGSWTPHRRGCASYTPRSGRCRACIGQSGVRPTSATSWTSGFVRGQCGTVAMATGAERPRHGLVRAGPVRPLALPGPWPLQPRSPQPARARDLSTPRAGVSQKTFANSARKLCPQTLSSKLRLGQDAVDAGPNRLLHTSWSMLEELKRKCAVVGQLPRANSNSPAVIEPHSISRALGGTRGMPSSRNGRLTVILQLIYLPGSES